MKILRYTIKTVIEIPANELEWGLEIQEVINKGEELGTSEIVLIELLEAEKNPMEGR